MKPLNLRALPALLVTGTWLLSACASIVDNDPAQHVRGEPVTETAVLPAAWSSRLQSVASKAPDGGTTSFWAGFSDPDLNQLIEAARENAPDIRVAQANIRQARAGVELARARLRPSLGLGGRAAYQRDSAEAQLFTAPEGVPGGGFEIPLEYETYGLSATASWEPDVWGRNSLLIESAQYQVAAAEAQADATLLSLESEVARTYIALRELQARADLLDQSLDLLQENLSLSQQLEAKGLGSEFNTVQVQADLSTLRAQRSALASATIAQGYALSTLTGEAPQAISALLDRDRARIPTYEGDIPGGLPSDLLLRRPDIRAARASVLSERNEDKAEALNRLPSFPLTLEGGLAALDPTDLISWDARRGLISAAFNWPIFQGGRLDAQQDLEAGQTDAAEARYDAALLRSLGDVESAFEQLISNRAQLAFLRDAVAARTRVRDLAQLRFQSGLDSQFRVLEAESALLSARDALATAEAGKATAIITIRAALGGDWEPTDQ